MRSLRRIFDLFVRKKITYAKKERVLKINSFYAEIIDELNPFLNSVPPSTVVQIVDIKKDKNDVDWILYHFFFYIDDKYMKSRKTRPQSVPKIFFNEKYNSDFDMDNLKFCDPVYSDILINKG